MVPRGGGWRGAAAAFAAVLAACAYEEAVAEPSSRRHPLVAPQPSVLTDAPSPASAVQPAPVRAQALAGVAAPASSGVAPSAQDERSLRNAFAASASADEGPGLRLASFLAAAERFDEALHVLDMMLGRRRNGSVLVARAGVLRDLARNDAATADLEEVVRRRGRAGVTAGTLFELAQVQWLAGATAESAKTINDMLRLHVDSEYLAANRARVEDWYVRVQRPAGVVDSGDLRDAFALLRAAPQVTARLQMLGALAPEVLDAEGRRDVRLRAIAVGCGDPSAAVRTRAVQLAASAGIAAPTFWQAAVADADPMVRRAAARSCVKMGRASYVPLLLAASKSSRIRMSSWLCTGRWASCCMCRRQRATHTAGRAVRGRSATGGDNA